MRTFIENYLHFMKNCIRPHYEKLKPLKSGFIENSNFENNRDPWLRYDAINKMIGMLAEEITVNKGRAAYAGKVILVVVLSYEWQIM